MKKEKKNVFSDDNDPFDDLLLCCPEKVSGIGTSASGFTEAAALNVNVCTTRQQTHKQQSGDGGTIVPLNKPADTIWQLCQH